MKREPALHVVKPAEAEPAVDTPPSKLQRFQDKDWKYMRSESTDITKLFARVRREQAKASKPKGKK